MSVAFDIRPPPPELAREDVRRGLVALLRRRVPSQEVDDLAQTILCDALQAGSIPSDPEDLRRWLVGIARHKIADYHRRATRVGKRSAGEAPLASCSSAPVAFEEREVLHRVLGDVRTRRDAETMEWLVREHGGERLADIAAENGLGAPVVRQRVSRLRRVLRSRWAGAVAVLVAIGAAAAFLGRPEIAIAPEKPVIVRAPEVPASASPEPLPPLLGDIAGEWVVQAVRPERELTANEQKMVDLYAKAARATVAGARITVRANAFADAWTVERVEGTTLVVVDDHGRRDRVDLVYARDKAGPRIDVRLPGHPRLAGHVTLRRAVH
ncbi:MAG: sigma-70 family RNA polymerase sigma factor [Labilithrix sp.]|nr:sigma-70 family RNA polymerase sigma factor [Labilithrix sp.]MCW5810532.1 sigma-70 family RNA polymerase sigma factor [Labilithrix sp.]